MFHIILCDVRRLMGCWLGRDAAMHRRWQLCRRIPEQGMGQHWRCLLCNVSALHIDTIVLDKRWQLCRCRQSDPARYGRWDESRQLCSQSGSSATATVFGRSCCNGSRKSTNMIPTYLVSICEWCWFNFHPFYLTKSIDIPTNKMRMHPRTRRM